MLSRRGNNFFIQLKNFTGSIVALLKDLFVFRPMGMLTILALSSLGTTLQAASLGAAFFTLRHLENGLYINTAKVIPFWDIKVHAAVLLIGILVMLGTAVGALYWSDMLTFRLSKAYSNRCSLELMRVFPSAVFRMKTAVVHPNSGWPLALSSELKRQGLLLELASRTLVRTPQSLFQILYGLGFLLFLEPKLTLILFTIALPLLVPFNKLTQGIKEAERRRNQAFSNPGFSVERLALEGSRLPTGLAAAGRRYQSLFDATAFAMASHYRYKRLVGQAGARGIAGSMLIIAGIVCMVYFWLFFRHRELPLALIVVYFGALRMTSTSGRQLVARVAAYARFYERVHEFFKDQEKGDTQENDVELSRSFGVKGLNPDRPDCEVVIRGTGPFAAVGTFPLSPLNRYLMAFVLPNTNHRKRKRIIASTIVVPEAPDLDLNVTWRDFLGITEMEGAQSLEKRLASCCRILDSAGIVADIDKPINRTHQFSTAEAIEAMLLRIYFQETPIVVVQEAALAHLGPEVVSYWQKLLSKQLVFIYYQSDKAEYGCWGETHAVLIRNDIAVPGWVTTVAWIKANPGWVKENLRGTIKGEQDVVDVLNWDDEEDD